MDFKVKRSVETDAYYLRCNLNSYGFSNCDFHLNTEAKECIFHINIIDKVTTVLHDAIEGYGFKVKFENYD